MSSKAAASDASAASARYYQIASMSAHDLESLFLRGTTPDLDELVGWEFRGMNHPAWARIAGIKKFIKGFFVRDDQVYGYNSPVRQNRNQAPWIARPSHEQPKRFGYYRVTRVDPTARDNRYLHAVLLDYGRGGNKVLDPTRNIRDYLIQVDPDNSDLYLGKAFFALGPLRLGTNFFLLERLRPGLGPIRHAHPEVAAR